jgi:hypothetical protein
MNSYVYHMKGALDRYEDGTVMEGTCVVTKGWYVYFTDDNNVLFDIAGPFDDEVDAEDARRRGEEWAA